MSGIYVQQRNLSIGTVGMVLGSNFTYTVPYILNIGATMGSSEVTLIPVML
jgi:hypothetical protein